MKLLDYISTILGVIGGAVAAMFGGWTSSLTTLLIFMGIDYFTGLIVAGVFHNSNKSETGALQSKAGWKGLCRKGITLLIVLVACRLDLTLNTTFIRDAAVIAFIVNELVSIVENAGLMGIPIPRAITNGIDILKKRIDSDKDSYIEDASLIGIPVPEGAKKAKEKKTSNSDDCEVNNE